MDHIDLGRPCEPRGFVSISLRRPNLPDVRRASCGDSGAAGQRSEERGCCMPFWSASHPRRRDSNSRTSWAPEGAVLRAMRFSEARKGDRGATYGRSGSPRDKLVASGANDARN